jgi:hypothetical protein
MIGSGTETDPYRVDLPTWQGIEFDTDGRVEYDPDYPDPSDPRHIKQIIPGKKPPAAKAIVEVPDDEVDDKGKIKRGYLKVKYRGSKWEKHEPDIGNEELV